MLSVPLVPVVVPVIVTAYAGARPVTQTLLTASDLVQIIDALEFAQVELLRVVEDYGPVTLSVTDTLRQRASNWYEIRLKLTEYVTR